MADNSIPPFLPFLFGSEENVLLLDDDSEELPLPNASEEDEVSMLLSLPFAPPVAEESSLLPLPSLMLVVPALLPFELPLELRLLSSLTASVSVLPLPLLVLFCPVFGAAWVTDVEGLFCDDCVP